MSDRVVSFSIKPHDVRSIELVKETKRIIRAKGLPSFSYLMLQALDEYMKKHHNDSSN